MIWWRAIWIFLLAAAIALLAAQLADQPGFVLVRWLGFEVETNIAAVIVLAFLFLLVFLGMRFIARMVLALFGR